MFIIGSDIDGCILDPMPNIKYKAMELYDVEIDEKRITQHGIHLICELSEDQVSHVVDEALKLPFVDIYEEAVNFLNRIVEEKRIKYFYFITARSEKHRKITDYILSGLFTFPFTVIYSPVSKALVASALGLRIFLEDRVKNAVSIADYCPQCSVIVPARIWNQHLPDDGRSNLFRVDSWEKAEKIARRVCDFNC